MAKWLNVTIKRSRWRHGVTTICPDNYAAYLLDDRHKMCCLGFVARASGLPASQILFIPLPTNVLEVARKGAFAKLVSKGHNTPTCEALAKWNDTPPIPAKQESTIIRLMRKIGVKAKFVD